MITIQQTFQQLFWMLLLAGIIVITARWYHPATFTAYTPALLFALAFAAALLAIKTDD